MTKFSLIIPMCFVVASGCALSDSPEMTTETPAVSVPVLASEAPAPEVQSSAAKEAPVKAPRNPSAEDIRLVQTRLRELGFDPGPVDGVAGARTKAAFVRLQAGCMKVGSLIENLPGADAPAGRAAMKPGRDETLKLQSQLRSAGFDPGPVDGVYGNRTKTVATHLRDGCQLAKEFDLMLDHSSTAANHDPASTQSLATPTPPSKTPSTTAAEREETVKSVAATQPAPSQEEIRILQLRLRDAGFNPGPFDGMMGPKTRAALQQYEASQRGRKTKASLTTRNISDHY